MPRRLFAAVFASTLATALVCAQSAREPTKVPFGSSYYLLETAKPTKREPRPLIVMLHGSGGRPEHCRACHAAAVEKGYVVCLPASVDPAQYDGTDEKQILAMVEDVLAKNTIDRDRILLTGHSAGGAISFFLVSKRPDLFTACAAGAAGLRFPAEQLRGAVHVPFYIATGGRDFNRQECLRSKAPLEGLGIAVTCRDEPDEDHGLAPAAWQAMFAWFEALVPRDQGKQLQAARAALDAKAWGNAAKVLTKLSAAKTTTEHVRRRAGLMLAAIDKAADEELAGIFELVDDREIAAAIRRLEKAKAAFAGSAAEARIDAELAECRTLLPAK